MTDWHIMMNKWEEFMVSYRKERDELKREIDMLKAQLARNSQNKDKLRDELYAVKNEIKASNELIGEMEVELRTNKGKTNEELAQVKVRVEKIEREGEDSESSSERDENYMRAEENEGESGIRGEWAEGGGMLTSY